MMSPFIVNHAHFNYQLHKLYHFLVCFADELHNQLPSLVLPLTATGVAVDGFLYFLHIFVFIS